MITTEYLITVVLLQSVSESATLKLAVVRAKVI